MTPNKKQRTAGTTRVQKKEKGGRVAGPKRTPVQKILRVLFIVATVLAALIVALFIVYKILVVKPELPGPSGGQENPGGVVEVQPNEGPKTSGDRKEEFYTFMLVGRDTYGGGNTDTIMVMAYDVPNQQLSVMSIPRDTMVNVPWDIKRINSVYNFAPYYDKEGIEFLKEEISALIGFQPDYTIVIEWEAVGTIVDAIGGVNFTVPFDMYYNDLSQDFKIDLKAGYQNLDGDEAMQLLRYRQNSIGDTGKIDYSYGYANGDLGRIKTQQAFLSAMIKQCMANIIDFDTIKALASVFSENVTTELTVNNLAWFAKEIILGGLRMENINFVTLPNQGKNVYSRTYENYQSYVTPIPDEMLKLVNDYFNPYQENIQLHQLDLMIVNADGSLSSTTGYVADAKATQPPPAKPQQLKPEETEEPEEPEEPEVPVETQLPEPEEPTPGIEPETPSAEPEQPVGEPELPVGAEPGVTEDPELQEFTPVVPGPGMAPIE